MERMVKLTLPTDSSELRALRTMIDANDSLRTLGMISEEEHQRTLRQISQRIGELEHIYGLDILP